MKTFDNFRKVINESDYILSEAQRYLEILLEKDSEALKQYKASKKSFQKGFGKNIKPTVVQPGLDLYKAGGPFVPDKTTFADTGKKVPKMEPKPQFGTPKGKSKAPNKTALKKAISDIRASDKRLYDAGVGKKPSLVQQRKYTKERIKQLSRQTTLKDKLYGSTGSTEGAGGANTGTKPQKSASALEYTKKINQANKNRKEFTGNKTTTPKTTTPKTTTNKVVDLATKKQQSKLSKAAKDITQQRDDAIVKREKLRSEKGVKDTKAIRSTNRQVKELDKLAKQTQKAASGAGNPNAPVKYNKMTAGADFIKKNRKSNTKLVTKPAIKKSVSFKIPGGEAIGEPKLPKFSTGITKSGNISFAKDPTKLGGMKLNKTTQAIVKRETSKVLRRPENVKYAVASAKRKGLAKGLTRVIGKLGPKGRLAATVIGGAGSVAAINPGVRRFIRNTAIGTGIAAALGFGKKEKVLKKGDGLKTVGKVDVRYGLTGTSKKGQGGKVYDPKQMAQLGKVQKNFIDKYNQKARINPFKKQIQYKPKGDGTYTILDPKKK
jgi:hypothetical protein